MISRAKNDGQMKSRNDGMVGTYEQTSTTDGRGMLGFKRSERQRDRVLRSSVLHTFPIRPWPSQWCALVICAGLTASDQILVNHPCFCKLADSSAPTPKSQ